MRTVRDAYQFQPKALSVKLSDQIEQPDALLTAAGDGSQFFEQICLASSAHGSEALAALTSEMHMEERDA